MKSQAAILAECIRRKGLRRTREREIILGEILSNEEHFSVEELYERLRAKGARVSRASIYRTLPLLAECGLVREALLEHGQRHYESTHGRGHHCHLRCLSCGRIVEFSEPSVERLEGTMERRHGFRIVGHKLELYGYCPECSGKNEG